MNKSQIVILALLVTLVVGIFGVLAYLFIFNAPSPAGPTTATSPQSTSMASKAVTTAKSTTTPKTVPTATKWMGVTSTSAEGAQAAGQATAQVVAVSTAEAKARIDAALRSMPDGEANLTAENDRLAATVMRIGWLEPGALWVRVRLVNLTKAKLSVSPNNFILVDAKQGRHKIDSAASALPGALAALDLATGGQAEGQISFRLPVMTAPTYLIYDDGKSTALSIDVLTWIVSQPLPTATPAQ